MEDGELLLNALQNKDNHHDVRLTHGKNWMYWADDGSAGHWEVRGKFGNGRFGIRYNGPTLEFAIQHLLED